MGLFGSSNTDDNAPTMATQSSPSQDQVNLVGEGTVLEGTLRAEDDVRTSGRIVGTLQVDGKAMVAESGSVEGEIYATNADIAGHVEGELHVKERLVLKSTARIDGRIETDRLVVEEGAEFSGECKMDGAVSMDSAPEPDLEARPGAAGHQNDAATPDAPDLDLPDDKTSEGEQPAE